jgi:hypothetical protein
MMANPIALRRAFDNDESDAKMVCTGDIVKVIGCVVCVSDGVGEGLD